MSNLGLGLLGFGDFEQALTCLNEALRIARAVGTRYVEPHVLRHLAALAFRAATCSPRGPTRSRRSPSPPRLRTGSAQRIHWTCYRVLERLADARATNVLNEAHGEWQAQAARISDVALHECFLTRIAVNRDIVQAWRRGNPGVAPA